MSTESIATPLIAVSPFNCWTMNRFDGFTAMELVLNKDEYIPVVSDVPPRFVFGESTMGVNTYRFNAFIKGRMLLSSPSIPDSYRIRGDDVDPSRFTIKGSYLLVGAENDSRFTCINYTRKDGKLFLSRNYPLAPGEAATIEVRELERHVFIMQGGVQLGESGIFSAGTHLKLSKPEEYTFTNVTQEDAFLIFVYEVNVADVRALFNGFDPAFIDSAPIFSDQPES